MQQAENFKYTPLYVERITLFFTPSGSIIMRIGNQHIIASSAEVSDLIKNRLEQHTLFAELFNRVNGGTHAAGTP
jgi:hypothetical protein